MTGLTGDSTRITADTTHATADGRLVPMTCAGLGIAPPSVADREAQPTADDLLPQILQLTPRGAAWGTDEVGDGRGASPVQRRVWRALAAFVADHLGRDWLAATQALPSAVTYTLPDWEADLGLPDACLPAGTDAQRIAAVRSRHGGLGPVTPNDFRCYAAGLGYVVRIEEPRQFRCSESACVGPGLVETAFLCGDADSVCGATPVTGYALPAPTDIGDQCAGGAIPETAFRCGDGDSVCGETPVTGFGERDPAGTVSKFMVVHLASGGDTAFACGDLDSQCGFTPVTGFKNAAALECAIRAVTPEYLIPVFDYRG
ncbi:hypothetical protein MCBMB27_02640 [Methylobacterium phyllosphaerae]|uniref:DUF2313 domain-containing protein n=1 Tax=Methylobacterium phyllosphaerae TaxID=418223 RepID=A0AAE8HSH5_9HYPH|nr:DUF2313 domain-containing protein [Methylobacterium phyllosphaerae]APT31931.1 hypothetical protein MCBMB27_02640 [Methylobacterium phyllosphaerae]SFH01348.1 hypothetical protein SAMN05192567_11227 [Methylobacterium phyllosphaerae]